MKEIFYLKQHNCSTRGQHLEYPNPRTIRYGLETFGYKACQIWNSIPKEVQWSTNVTQLKSYLKNNSYNICKCNMCKLFVPNLGYIIHIIQLFLLHLLVNYILKFYIL